MAHRARQLKSHTQQPPAYPTATNKIPERTSVPRRPRPRPQLTSRDASGGVLVPNDALLLLLQVLPVLWQRRQLRRAHGAHRLRQPRPLSSALHAPSFPAVTSHVRVSQIEGMYTRNGLPVVIPIKHTNTRVSQIKGIRTRIELLVIPYVRVSQKIKGVRTRKGQKKKKSYDRGAAIVMLSLSYNT